MEKQQGTPMPARKIAIGDIHGCSTALAALVQAIDPQPDDTIITLGDYVDRGIDSKVFSIS
jgi:serine/threonine protein phosphatase 1